MSKNNVIQGTVVPLPNANLDTDQIMPKQFLRGIDKSGLAKGVFHDLRFDEAGFPRADFVMNQPKYANASIILGGPNFGCGSSREHAVWGLKQFGIRAIIASSFGEIFYSNSMNNGLMLATVSKQDEGRLFAEQSASEVPIQVTIDVANLQVISATGKAPFTLSERHQRMFMEGLDMLGASLLYLNEIQSFAGKWHEAHPWLKNVVATTRTRLDQSSKA